MKAPNFWNHKGIASTFLSPLAALYQFLGELRWKITTPMEMPIPILCIGNVVAGGAGKTPVALAIGTILKAKNQKFHYLSRGYGGKTHKTPICVTPRHEASEIGDEPLLLSQIAPCWVCRDRRTAATEALRAGAPLLIMDDGYQNPLINKSLNIVVIDGAYGLGNGCIMPAGPLRESLRAALTRADAVIFIGRDQHHLRQQIPSQVSIFTGHIEPVRALAALSQPVLAFAGIGRPEKFFTMLKEAEVEIAATAGFPDHHRYTAKEIQGLRSQAKAQNATPTCTAKDAVKLPREFREEVQTVDIAFHFDDLRGFTEWLETKL